MSKQERTLVVGLGNPILSDDGIGWHIVAAVRERLAELDDPCSGVVDLREVSLGGLALAEMLVGYSQAILVDAIITPGGVPGTVRTLSLKELPGTLNTASAHDTNLVTALRTLRRFGVPLPPEDLITIVAVEVQDVWTFSEGCSDAVTGSIGAGASCVLAVLAGEQLKGE